jgi:CRP-like cAMP-binding protein
MSDHIYLARFLQQVRVFRGLDAHDLAALARAARISEVERDGCFFREGTPADLVYLLQRGWVKITRTTPEGLPVLLLRIVGPGELLASTAAVEERSHSASAVALCWCQALAWEPRVLSRLIEDRPHIAREVCTDLAHQMLDLQNRYEELATRRVEGRISRTLLRLAQQAGRQTAEGLLIDVPLSRQDLAAMTGTTLYTVSRVLREWVRRGVIAAGRQWVAILRLNGLLAMGCEPAAEGLPKAPRLHPAERSMRGQCHTI